ncbi:ATP-dependent RNA helicase RhlB [hydrothermal vent metagenome]|uniref:ATP-dependent RNA helicase RhlB n=1 Tax=hydrothermal vent metagenome TaxID=652676 RepID=A0A3B1BE19_9ZZZZ
MTDKHITDIAFKSFDLPANLLQGIEDTGFSYCTPIQAETLPVALGGRDVSGQAQTGTGKTAAFLIALFARLLANPPELEQTMRPLRAIILAPTRELALQIHSDAEKLGAHTGLKLGLAYGGTGYETQRRTLEDGVDVLIGTPGRIIDYFKQGVFKLNSIQVMVLDEADRMFDLGFIKDIRYLLRRMPKPELRQSLLFSATLSHRVAELAYEHMNNPQPIKIESEKITADKVTEAVYYPAKEEKIPLLLGLLNTWEVKCALVFVNTKRVAERVAAYLGGNGYETALLTGDVPQKKRQSLLKRFTDGELKIMVATDVAARGLHIPDVSHVINFDLPQDAEDYVHRIGRTARAGAKGDAISFACDEYVFSMPDIEEYVNHKIPVQKITTDILMEPQPPLKIERKPRHQGGGRGSSNRGGRAGNSSSRHRSRRS